ncbi:hypothetical protein PsYK624_029240 [Phanerochaete sordida]|uniref:Uncharacterized protein n=1 Tax=Phanerochaete sordida TaxID=48140 RepID=A0A9P3G224_9APHY|nr:hypothetical protein PsYK624_029240 [Phanerochaete sordida]
MDTEHKKFASSNGIMDRFKSHEGWNYSKVQLDRLQDAMAKLPPEQVCSFIEAKAKALRTRREQTPLLVRWKKEEKAIRAGERQYAQAQRHQAIKQKLIDLGWGEELDMVDEEEFRLHPLVAQPKPLTERIWNGIKTQMIDYMVECQQGRLYDERGDLVRQRLRALQRATASTLYNNEDGPSLYQIATGIPEITKILRLPEDVVIDEESFDWVLSELPSFIDNWKNTVRTRLSNLVRANVDIAETTDPFALAVAVSFRCKRCLGLFRPPWLFSHHCTVPLRPSSAELDYCTALIAETFTDQQCESDDFKDLAEIRKHVIALCGEDPKTATADELDSSAVRLTCPQHNYTGVISVMTWSAMVEHYRLHHRTLSDLGQLQVVPERFREIYRRLERITWSSAENKLANMNVWQCLHCKSRRLMTLSQITHHMLFQSLISPSTHPSDRRTDERKNMKCVRDCPEVVYLFDASMRVELDDLYHSLSDWTAATFVEL